MAPFNVHSIQPTFCFTSQSTPPLYPPFFASTFVKCSCFSLIFRPVSSSTCSPSLRFTTILGRWKKNAVGLLYNPNTFTHKCVNMRRLKMSTNKMLHRNYYELLRATTKIVISKWIYTGCRDIHLSTYGKWVSLRPHCTPLIIYNGLARNDKCRSGQSVSLGIMKMTHCVQRRRKNLYAATCCRSRAKWERTYRVQKTGTLADNHARLMPCTRQCVYRN